MQPPPRKGNYVKFLKNLHTEQVAKLQLKNQHECDLLEDIRQFTIKRSAIEKSYSESLLKISSQYLNKKIPNIPDIKMEGMEERWNMWSVWRTVLEENEKLARARLAAIEVFQQQIADEAKVLRDYKLAISKRSLAQIVNVQKELHLSVSDVDKTKKQYFDEEHCAHDVRDKARDIEEKLKKKKGSFFQSITSLQKNSARVTSRKELLEEKSTGARNDYILSLAAANAHQNRYFTVDLQTTMTTMENYVFERVAEYLTLMGRTELLTCSATQNSFGKIRDQAQQLTREYNLQCCYLFYPVLKQHIQYDFEACDNDPVRKITIEHESASETLTKEAKNLAGRVVKENLAIREAAKKLAICVSLRDSGQRSDPNDPNGPDLDTKIEEFRDLIRRSETEKAKAEACLQCLREGGINVDEWVQEAEIMGVQELVRSASSISMRTDASGEGENPSSDSFYDSDKDDATGAQVGAAAKSKVEKELSRDKTFSDSEEEVEERVPEPIAAAPVMASSTGWDDPTEVNWGGEGEEKDESIIPEPKEAIFKCTALYSYTAQNPDELTIVENEQLEVIGEGDGDGWLRARNYRGEEGYVPHNYLDIEQDTALNGSSGNQLRSQISFSSVDYTVDNEDQTVDSMQSPDQVSVIMAPQKKKPDVLYCIALYDYDATAEDELTFEEGQIIKIITKTAHGVDDGWWEGELDGKFGNFPSLVVEECDENGEALSEGGDESPPPTAPPSFALPPAPALPPEYAHELTEDMFESQETADDDSGYIPNGGAPSMPPPASVFQVQSKKASVKKVLIQEPGMEDDISDDGNSPPSLPPPALNICSSKEGNSLNLGMAQIIVTAATPMVEDGTDKSFPPVGESDGGSADAATAKTASSDDGKPVKQKKVEPKQLAQIAADENENHEDDTHSSDQDPDSEVKTLQEAEDPFNEKGSVDAGNGFEANFEANFDANFDDAFAGGAQSADLNAEPSVDDVQAPKQVVGGRASIPEELDSNQLARLQNLKESNA
ncbi:protein nervous wreck isoform X3 [Anastrepha ludens]|uniref:protein nervous wreck isoform X3 n=1 Tax=Anastrepha ludens TaxID=28586 RepID=UPI0023AF6389|nr:protein nervous wreck isoform X3 [Anastrepha ludens]XP_053956002.1 protein nervous wreck isoform X3 [Anastrepha ludens]XP_053956003.1 protein nervous wreck isoform X3 [Anastrepha ludens]XP_053956004.1 protein nervous wreck isoform X3 [Anastrepha ludens]XP_053956005.1 protein nervous wreck isoform X3 [Anastrepha ludens]XP_053956006.1 protein nervous wreck isoform X3 [Anastrepha ludens]XP_053956007.1 protein nervous wreck isoform X3 [Anastrepha ludens]